MESFLESCGVWLARAYAAYGFAILLIPAIFFLDALLLIVLGWAFVQRSRGRRSWLDVSFLGRSWVRLAIELKFGLINPVLYLAIFTPALDALRGASERWPSWLQAGSWGLLAAFWILRLFGAAPERHPRAWRLALRALLAASLAWLLAYTVKDAWLFFRLDWSRAAALTPALNLLRVSPLYLIPALLLVDHLLSALTPRQEPAGNRDPFFLLPHRAARRAVASVAAFALLTAALAAYRRSDFAVRRLVSAHREHILASADIYDVDPRIVASIVYVTQRDQVSPFRGALERLVASAWANNLRGDFGQSPPDNTGPGADENPLLNRALDISIGLAQIKPRTALTASVLATGKTPDQLPEPMYFSYKDAEPIGAGWTLPAALRISTTPPIPLPAAKPAVARILLHTPSNIAACALILSLYQKQWEAANPAWSLRDRPDILATLYQIGFARSNPHPTPQSNAFGQRVHQVLRQPWLTESLYEPHSPN